MLSIEPQSKREQARSILAGLMAEARRIPIAQAMEAAAEQDISSRTMQRAKADLGLVEVHNGPFGAFWELVEAPPVEGHHNHTGGATTG